MIAKALLLGLLGLGSFVLAEEAETAQPQEGAAPPPPRVVGPVGVRGPLPRVVGGRPVPIVPPVVVGGPFVPPIVAPPIIGGPIVAPPPIVVSGGPPPPPVVINGPPQGGYPSAYRYCEALNIPSSRLPPDCKDFCRANNRQPWFC